MTREEFTIGEEFHCGGRRWRCTDIGTRVVTGIRLEPREIVETERDTKGNQTRQCRVSNEPAWITGPPYAVTEQVFDEDDIPACTRKADAS